MMIYSFAKELIKKFLEHGSPRMAAALAFYATLALPALLTIVVAIASAIYSTERVTSRIEFRTEQMLGKAATGPIVTMLQASQLEKAGRGTWFLGIASLLFGATAAIAHLQQALNSIWEVNTKHQPGAVKRFLFRRLVSLAVVLGTSLLVIVSLALSTAISAIHRQVGNWLPGEISKGTAYGVDTAVAFLLMVIFLATIYKSLPDVEVKWSAVFLGSIFAATLFVSGKMLVGIYLGMRHLDSTYGAAGSIILILIWIYYSANIVLLGAEFTQVWSTRRNQAPSLS